MEAIPSVFNVPTHSPSTKKEQTTHENPARKRLFASDNNFITPSDSPSFFDSQLQRKALRKEKTITSLITQLNKQKVLSK